MWEPHRQAVLRNGCLQAPRTDQRWRKPAGPSLEPQHLGLSPPCPGELPDYSMVKSLALELVRPDPGPSLSGLRMPLRTSEHRLPAGQTTALTGSAADDPAEDPRAPRGPPFDWIWEDFSVDDYTPPSAARIPANSPEPPPPLAGVPAETPKVASTSRDEERRRRKGPPQAARGETGQPAPFRARPVPDSTRLPLYRRLVEERGRRREVLHQKHRALLLGLQPPFLVGCRPEADPGGAPGREGRKESPPTPRARKEVLEKSSQTAAGQSPAPRTGPADTDPTPQPAINRVLPDFCDLRRRSGGRLDRVRDEKAASHTAPPPFGFRTDRPPVPDGPPRQQDAGNQRLSSGRKQPERDQAGTSDRSLRHTKSAMLRKETVRRRLEEREAAEAEGGMTPGEEGPALWTGLRRQVALWLAGQRHPSSAQTQRSRLRRYREEARARSAEYRAELAEMLDRVSRRPLLVERTLQSQARRATEGHFTAWTRRRYGDGA